MNQIAIGPEGRFSFGGENFVVTVPVKEPRLSMSEAFTIAKSEPYLRVYEDLASDFSPRSAQMPGEQSPDAPFSKRHAFSNLLFEQIMLMGSPSLIAEIRVWNFLYLIRKAESAPSGSKGESGSIFDRVSESR